MLFNHEENDLSKHFVFTAFLKWILAWYLNITYKGRSLQNVGANVGTSFGLHMQFWFPELLESTSISVSLSIDNLRTITYVMANHRMMETKKQRTKTKKKNLI